MEDPTVEFRFIPFSDVRDAPYRASAIERGHLVDRIVFARTGRGNYAKFQVKGGPNLLITRLVLYDPAGCILRTSANVTIRSSHSCDLDNASESAVGADFEWQSAAGTESFLVPTATAVFHLHRGFDDATFPEVRDAGYSGEPIPAAFLVDQVLYCRTRRGRFAKLRVEAGAELIVRSSVVFRADGHPEPGLSNIHLPAGRNLDLETGAISTREGDLRWDAFALRPVGAAALSFDSWYRFRKYEDLLQSPAIGAALQVRSEAHGPVRDYAHWTAAERWQLWEFLQLRETGRALPIDGPPPLLQRDAFFIRFCDAWKIYLAHVAQSLWVDANARVSWRLSDAGAEELEPLFRMDTVIDGLPGRYHLGQTTQWNPEGSYSFLTGGAMVGPDQWSTIKNVVEWCRIHLWHGGFWFHESEQDFLEELYGYRGPPLVERMIDPVPGHHWTTLGCSYTDSFLAQLLRTVNIPMRDGITIFSGGRHSRAEFFTVGFNLAHGDDPYNGWTYRGHHIVPIERLFYTDAELAELIDYPRSRPGMTLSETASFNAIGRQIAMAVEFKTEYLLHMRCLDRESGAAGHASRLWIELHAHYSDAEIDVIAADCDREIDAIGGCAALLWP